MKSSIFSIISLGLFWMICTPCQAQKRTAVPRLVEQFTENFTGIFESLEQRIDIDNRQGFVYDPALYSFNTYVGRDKEGNHWLVQQKWTKNFNSNERTSFYKLFFKPEIDTLFIKEYHLQEEEHFRGLFLGANVFVKKELDPELFKPHLREHNDCLWRVYEFGEEIVTEHPVCANSHEGLWDIVLNHPITMASEGVITKEEWKFRTEFHYQSKIRGYQDKKNKRKSTHTRLTGKEEKEVLKAYKQMMKLYYKQPSDFTPYDPTELMKKKPIERLMETELQMYWDLTRTRINPKNDSVFKSSIQVGIPNRDGHWICREFVMKNFPKHPIGVDFIHIKEVERDSFNVETYHIPENELKPYAGVSYLPERKLEFDRKKFLEEHPEPDAVMGFRKTDQLVFIGRQERLEMRTFQDSSEHELRIEQVMRYRGNRIKQIANFYWLTSENRFLGAGGGTDQALLTQEKRKLLEAWRRIMLPEEE